MPPVQWLATACLLAATASAQSGRANERLTREVRHELVMLPFYGVFDNLMYRVEGDKVTLLGQVTRPSLKTDAERAVRKIEGVGAVENRIEILPHSPNDEKLRLALYRAIYSNLALSLYGQRAVPPIHILVKNGNVALEGVVAEDGEKDIAGTEAKRVPGVFSVTNNLQVDEN